MAQPTPYDRQFSFQDFQASQPTTPLPGDEVDGEFNAVKLTIDQLLVNLAKIQRDDGALKNGSVGQDQLSPSLSIGFTYRGVWDAGQNYVQSDGVSIGSLFYRAKVANFSSVDNAPPTPPATNAFWELIADITPLGIAVNSVYTAALQDGVLSADAAGRAKMAANYITLSKLIDGILSADVAGRAKMADGFLSADATGRAKMADGFLSADATGRAKMADGFLSAAEITSDTGELAEVRAKVAFVPRGHLYGLTLSNNVTDATNDIDIAAGEAGSEDSTSTLMTLGSALTKRLDAAWAVGSGNGGLDTGSIANTTYHVWLIRRPDTGVVDALFSASATAPTMPANYTQKRRIGSIIRAAGAIVAFTQQGDEFLRSVVAQDITTTVGTTAALFTLSLPVGVKVEAMVEGFIFRSGTSALLLTSPDQADTAPTTGGPATAVNDANVSGSFQRNVLTNTSGQIRARSSVAATSIWIATTGWIDRRGRL